MAHIPVHRSLRIAAACLTGLAATGWLLDRIGLADPVGTAADATGSASPWIVAALWGAALAVTVRRHQRRGEQPSMQPTPERTTARVGTI